MDLNALYQELEAVYPKMVELRRDFHQHPEISFQEVRTPQKIAEYLESLGIEVETGVGGRGVVGRLRGNHPGKTIALRADFDALPIQDEKDVPYKSTIDGAMHACGHDGHTAILLGVATVLAKYKDQLKGEVVFIHQFAEELMPGGAKPMIEDGCLDGVDVIFGTHLQSTLPSGHIYYREGALQAASDKFDITVIGQGGHGAVPQETVDPVMIATQLAVNLNQLVSRRIDPLQSAVLSIGSIQSGDAFNVIPDTARLLGTVRTYDEDVRNLLEKEMEQVSVGLCEANRAKCDFHYERGYDALINHAEPTKYIRQVAEEVLGEGEVHETPPVMPGEDYSYYLQKVPGTFFFTGAKLDDPSRVYPHHHPRFDFDEAAMKVAAKVFLATIAKYDHSS